ncbi:MAG: PAS domain-containing protein [Campylobacterales bacterium]|nr:PAS domain-containing protein [Campylobacterales bacterium]
MKKGFITLLFFLTKLFSNNVLIDNGYFENNGLIFLVIEPTSGKIIKANKSASKFYGYSKTQLENMTIQDINQFTKAQVQEEMRRAKKENRNHFIFRHELNNGQIKKVEVYSYPIKYQDQNVLFSTIYDISRTDDLTEIINHYSKNLEEQVDKKTRENTLILTSGLFL